MDVCNALSQRWRRPLGTSRSTRACQVPSFTIAEYALNELEVHAIWLTKHLEHVSGLKQAIFDCRGERSSENPIVEGELRPSAPLNASQTCMTPVTSNMKQGLAGHVHWNSEFARVRVRFSSALSGRNPQV